MKYFLVLLVLYASGVVETYKVPSEDEASCRASSKEIVDKLDKLDKTTAGGAEQAELYCVPQEELGKLLNHPEATHDGLPSFLD